MKKIISIFLTALMLVSLFCGCSDEPKNINPDVVLQHLLSDVNYDVELMDATDLYDIYFNGLPEGTTAKLYVSSSGYFPDEVALLTVANESDIGVAKSSIEAHIFQVRSQFLSYIPEEVGKIDNAIIWQSGCHIFLVITNDTAGANAIFNKAHELSTAVSPSTTQTTVPTTEATTAPPETEPPTTAPPETEPPVEPTITSQSGRYYLYSNGIIKVDNSAFEPYGYVKNTAHKYAAEVTKVADALEGTTNVYCLPIPTAISIIFPDDIAAKYDRYPDQAADMEDIFNQMSENVIPVNCYQNLRMHRDEYLYYRTDYHWNGPAAYYAYETFCEIKGITPYTMEQREVAYFDNFLGYLYYNSSGCDPALGGTPDTVIAYYPYSQNTTMFFRDNAGNRTDYEIIKDVSRASSNNKYLCYAAGDQPYAEFHNPDVTDGSSLILIKESYGNVLLSYLIDHYSVIYEIDYRYWKGNIVDFAKEVNATDMMFANNMTMISSGLLVGYLSTITP